MGRRIYAQHYAVSHVPHANEPPYVVSVSMRHNGKQLEETMPVHKDMSPARRDRLRTKNIESSEPAEKKTRPTKKNDSDPFNKGVIPPIKGKKHIDDPINLTMRPRPIQSIAGGGSTANGYCATQPP